MLQNHGTQPRHYSSASLGTILGFSASNSLHWYISVMTPTTNMVWHDGTQYVAVAAGAARSATNAYIGSGYLGAHYGAVHCYGITTQGVTAVEIALAATGTYKLATKIGGN
jgi:hypothetical protein